MAIVKGKKQKGIEEVVRNVIHKELVGVEHRLMTKIEDTSTNFKEYVDSRISQVQHQMKQQFGEVQLQIGGMQGQIGGLQEQGAGFERRFDGIEHQIGGLQEQGAGFERRFDGIEQRIGGLQEQGAGFERRFGGIEHQIGDIKTDIKKLDKKIDVRTDGIVQLIETRVGEIIDLDRRITILEKN